MRMQIVVAALLLVSGTASLTVAQVPVTQLTAMTRQAGQAGTSLECRLETGQFLSEVDRMVFSHPLIQASVLHDAALPFDNQPPVKHGHFSVTIDASVPTGLYEAWVAGAFGVSNPLPFFVSQEPVVAVANEHAAAEHAVELVSGQWVQARCQAEQIQHYKLELQPGQRLQIRTLAQQLDSRAILQLRLFDPGGECVVDAVPIDGADPQFEYQADTQGTYGLQVSEFLFRGGSPYTYLLSAVVTAEADETGPVAIPLIEQIAQLQQLSQPGTPLPATIPRPASVDAASLPALPPGLQPLVHDEQAMADDQPTTIPLPGLVSGHFLSDRIDEDSFRFQASQGARIAIEVISQRLGQATDPTLLVFDSPAEGKPASVLAQNDDLAAIGTAAVRSAPRDPALIFTAPHDGEFVVAVRDQFNARPADAPLQYLLSVAPATPNFQLFAYLPHGSNNDAQSQPTGVQLSPGDVAAIEVMAIRQQGFNGPIDIATSSLPTGVSCPPARIAAGQNRATLTLRADATTLPTLHVLQIEGTAADLPKTNVRRAYAATIASAADGHRNVVGSRLTSALLLDVIDHRTLPIEITITRPAESLRMARGGKLPLPITVARQPESVDPCIFRARNLPANTSLPDLTLPPDQSTGQAELRIAPTAATGIFDFWVQAETTLTYAGNPRRKLLANDYLERLRRIRELDSKHEGLEEAIKNAAERLKAVNAETKPLKRKVFLPLESLRVEIVEAPFETVLADLAPVTAGTTADLKLSVTRQFGFAGPLTVDLIDPPLGITAPTTTLAADQTETVVTLTVPAEAAVGEQTLKLKLQFDFGGVQSVQRSAKLTIAK